MRLSSPEVLMLKLDSINLAASFRQASVHVYHFVEAICRWMSDTGGLGNDDIYLYALHLIIGWSHTQVELAHKAGHVAMFEVKRQDFLAEPLLVLDKKTAAILIEWKQEDVVWLTSLDICQTVSKEKPIPVWQETLFLLKKHLHIILHVSRIIRISFLSLLLLHFTSFKVKYVFHSSCLIFITKKLIWCKCLLKERNCKLLVNQYFR